MKMYCPECRKDVVVLERKEENPEYESFNIWCTECNGLLYGRYKPHVEE